MKGRYTTEEQDLARLIADLKRRIENLEAGNRAGATSVDKGSLNVKSGVFDVGGLLSVGPVDFGSGLSQGFIFRRADGTILFTLGGSSDTDQFWGLWDNSGNLIVSDDGQADQGLGVPYIPVTWCSSAAVAPTDTTTSGTFTGILSTRYIKQHPKLHCSILANTGAGTTGELQIVLSGTTTPLGSVASIPAAYYGLVFMDVTVPGDHLMEVELEIQARRTGGAGTIGARVWGSYGIQS